MSQIMLRDRIIQMHARLAQACSRAGRGSQEITVVAVAKGRSVEQIRETVAAGLEDIGENRVQEALLKFRQIRAAADGAKIRWHMVGHLQTNKVRDAVKIFDLIHSVDSLDLMQEIDRQANRLGKIQDILIEVKTSPEASKSGVKPGEADGLIRNASDLKNIRIRGLMTIAPVVHDPEQARLYFRQLRELRDQLGLIGILSMGMSDDFEVAVEEGATMVRIGRAIFEDL